MTWQGTDGLDFVAVDVETANAFRGSVCQVGLVTVRDGVIVDEWVSMMQPPAGHVWVDYERGQVHGFTTAELEAKQLFARVWPEVVRVLGDEIVVAHNAAFDVAAMQEAAAAGGFGELEFDFACSLVLSRRNLTLPSYTLDVVAQECGVVLGRHHDALADARAAAQITITLAARIAATSIPELAALSRVDMGHSGGGDNRPCRALAGAAVPVADHEPPLF